MRDPPKIVFNTEAVAVRANMGQSDPSPCPSTGTMIRRKKSESCRPVATKPDLLCVATHLAALDPQTMQLRLLPTDFFACIFLARENLHDLMLQAQKEKANRQSASRPLFSHPALPVPCVHRRLLHLFTPLVVAVLVQVVVRSSQFSSTISAASTFSALPDATL